MKFEDYKRQVGLYLLDYMDADQVAELMDRKIRAIWVAWQDGWSISKIGEWLR